MRFRDPFTRLIWIRHGTTDFPRKRLYCDDMEHPDLNDTGHEQAASSAELLANTPLDAIISSPIPRAQQTAEHIADYHPDCHIQTDPLLKERCFGIWEGMYFSEIERDFPDDYQRWKHDPTHFTPSGGETIADTAFRVEAIRNLIVHDHPEQTVAVVCHMGVIRVALCQAMNIPLEQHRYLSVDNASLTVIEYGKEHNNLRVMNLTGTGCAYL